MQIKAVVFDYGGVIELSPGKGFIEIASEILDISAKDFLEVYFKYNHLSNVHNRPWEEVFMKVVAHFADRTEEQEVVRNAYHEALAQRRINTELVELFPLLKKQGLKVGIFSNNTTALREKLRSLNLLTHIDEVVVSAEIGFQKPHKEAFEVLFERMQILPQDTVFVDDSLKSLEKAPEIGYHPIHFRSNDQLKVELRRLGVPV